MLRFVSCDFGLLNASIPAFVNVDALVARHILHLSDRQNAAACSLPNRTASETRARTSGLSATFRSMFARVNASTSAGETALVRVRGGLSESPFWLTLRPGLKPPVLPFEAITGKSEP